MASSSSCGARRRTGPCVLPRGPGSRRQPMPCKPPPPNSWPRRMASSRSRCDASRARFPSARETRRSFGPASGQEEFPQGPALQAIGQVDSRHKWGNFTATDSLRSPCATAFNRRRQAQHSWTWNGWLARLGTWSWIDRRFCEADRRADHERGDG